MNIFAIETSCDETALAYISLDKEKQTFQILDHIVYSQIDAHASYGGVVPALAARLHHKKLPEMIQTFISQNGRNIDAIAATVGPGLEPSLYAGVNQAKTLAVALGIPFIPVNHMHGHIWSGILDEQGRGQIPAKHIYPFIAFTISGGHTEMVLVTGYNQYRIIGQTLDDAAGEAFDKVAKMLDLGYPGGPKISMLANIGNPHAIPFPRPMHNSGTGDMSFSGLKTAVLYYIKSQESLNEIEIANICASFQEAVIDVLLQKLTWVVNQYPVNQVVFGGGVTANIQLRQRVIEWGKQHSCSIIIPNTDLSTDNAQMIAVVAALDILHHIHDRSPEVNGHLPL